MSNHRKQKLKKIISKGMLYYIVVYGILFWGLLTGALVSAISFFIHNEPIGEAIGSNFIAFPIGGIFFGLFMWVVLNNQYNKIRDDEL